MALRIMMLRTLYTVFVCVCVCEQKRVRSRAHYRFIMLQSFIFHMMTAVRMRHALVINPVCLENRSIFTLH